MIKAASYLQVDSKARGYGYFGMPPPPGVEAYGGTASKLCNVEIHNGRTKELKLTLDKGVSPSGLPSTCWPIFIPK